jgi:multicomponent Na+:H+ antiporter subunit D
LVLAISMIFLLAFGIKAAIFPLFFWLPASYHTPPVAISAIFAGMLTKVGVYALMRAFTLLFIGQVEVTHTILLYLALATMVTGVLGAAAHSDIRKILSFHIISQIGYMVLGLALYTTLGLTGAVFYLVHHIIVKGNLFLVAGLVKRVAGSFELARVGGLYKQRPLLAVLFLIPAFSLAGFPPLSGFWAKLVVIEAGMASREWWAVGIALAVGLLTIYSMTKIWQGAFWTPAPADAPPLATPSRLYYAPIAALALITVMIGLWSEPFALVATAAATEMLDPARYVTAVLGVDAAGLLGGTR